MSRVGRNSRTTIALIAVAAAVGLTVSGTLVFAGTDDTIRQGERSEWVEQFVDDIDPGVSSDQVEVGPRPSVFGGDGPSSTLVLYAGAGSLRARAELNGLAAANLATHFGQVEISTLGDYGAGQLSEFDALIYVGTSTQEEIPDALARDIRGSDTQVLWAGGDVAELAGGSGSEDAAAFVEKYGWDPSRSFQNKADKVETIRYHDVDFVRDARITGSLILPEIVDADRVEVLAEAICGSSDRATRCQGAAGTKFPWAIRSANLTFVGEAPFDYMDETSRYLVFADLLYDLLAPDTEPVQAAAVRIEDVGPETDPDDLRGVADFLYERGIPFQVAVMPIHIGPVPDTDPTRHYGRSLLDTPRVVKALQYMQERGGTLIQHGTTHQFGALDNPYDSSTASDFEFFRAQCTATATPPYEIEACEQDSWVRLTGPVSRDSVSDHEERLRVGRQVMIDAGLGAPVVFAVPHYAASPNAREAMSALYPSQYGRMQYVAGVVSGEQFDELHTFTQFFPYRVHDIYGSTVLPENLGNVTEEMQNNHDPRPPSFLVENARINLALRESTASFFFHPFLDIELLDEVVTGIEELGYTFVPAHQLP